MTLYEYIIYYNEKNDKNDKNPMAIVRLASDSIVWLI